MSERRGRAALAEEAAAGALWTPRLHGSTRGAPAKVLRGSGRSGDHRWQGIARAERLTGGGFGFNSGTGRLGVEGRSFGKLPGGEAELLRPLPELRCTGAADPRRSRGAERRSKAAAVLRHRWRPRRLGLGFTGGWAALCKAAALPWRAGPEEGRSPGISDRCASRKKEERGEDGGAARWGQPEIETHGSGWPMESGGSADGASWADVERRRPLGNRASRCGPSCWLTSLPSLSFSN
jgi:hypothetical protein